MAKAQLKRTQFNTQILEKFRVNKEAGVDVVIEAADVEGHRDDWLLPINRIAHSFETIIPPFSIWLKVWLKRA
ncbi:hypothetical protein GCM10010990_32160 [Croceicoccus mobilis]|uniref:Uncharacterized protein n=1 Tax=Croceicoccus mobilis TaxID=1703339 RepID=A0A917DY27_9SPHN|nr:hypothetical protein GCM10010990_32160 [Croceicoccus mobilis]